MHRTVIISIVGLLVITMVWVSSIWSTLSGPNQLGHGSITLLDRSGRVIAHRGMRGGYGLPYTGSLESQLVESIVRVEDQRYWSHHGVDLPSKVASLWQNLKAGGVVRGGSTLTEQYIKNAYYPTAPRTLIQKLRESAAAVLLEYRWSKEEILKAYLDSLYMGSGTYGVESMTGTGTEGIIDTITRIKYPNITESNSGVVASYRQSVIERLESDVTLSGGVQSPSRIPSLDRYPLLTSRVLSEIDRYCRGETNTLSRWTLAIPSDLCQSRYRTLTLTIDSGLMDHILTSGQGILESLVKKSVTNASVYIWDRQEEKIRAYVGSLNAEAQVDMIIRRRSVGSVLKPLVYLLALNSGVDMEDYLLDAPTSYLTADRDQDFMPENYNPKSYGPIRLREALGNSLNTATVRLTDRLGVSVVYDFLRVFGIDLDREVGHYGHGIAIGTVEDTLEHVVHAYSRLYKTDHPSYWQLAETLRNPRNRSMTFGYSSILNTSIPQAVKTGTSTDFRDNWTVSYGPKYVVGVWVGNNDGSSMRDVSGVSGAGPLWHSIVEYMIERGMIKVEKETVPPGLQQLSVCLNISCTQKELVYSQKKEGPKSRPKDKIFFKSDFFDTISPEELQTWHIQP